MSAPNGTRDAATVPAAAVVSNPLSPTFHEEQALEKAEHTTALEQKRDLRIKTRVRMAKLALRGVSFSCSLIIIAMLSASFSIFNATRHLAAKNNLPPWAPNTNPWSQIVVLVVSCISLTICSLVFISYCRGGHKRAEKIGWYYTLFALGWFVVSILIWAVAAAILQHSRNSGNKKDMWGWACNLNQRAQLFEQKVDYKLVCRLQNWTLTCILIEVVLDVVGILLHCFIIYRFWSKRKLHKTMDVRDRARSDLYLANLRLQSAPNTPGFLPGQQQFPQACAVPKSPTGYSVNMMSPRSFHPNEMYRNMNDVVDVEKSAALSHEQSNISPLTSQPFKLQTVPIPKAAAAAAGHGETPPPPLSPGEKVYESVPIPGAYGDAVARNSP